MPLLDRVGVLVGRNGAGKSAILEGFEAISSCAIGRFSQLRLSDSDSIPKILDIEISTPTERQIRYRYELILLPTPANDEDIDDSTSENSEESQFSWNERCQYVDGDQKLLWTTETRVTTLNNGNHSIVAILGRLWRSIKYELIYLKAFEDGQHLSKILDFRRFLSKETIMNLLAS